MAKALKTGGVLYASFKYGSGTCVRGDRVFSDFDENSVGPLFANVGFMVLSVVVGADSRLGRENEMWVNVIGRKCDH